MRLRILAAARKGEPSGKTDCRRYIMACQCEKAVSFLNLATLGAMKSTEAQAGLVYLLALRGDAEFARDLRCYMLSRRRTMLNLLAAADAKALRADCERDVAAAIAKEPDLLTGAKVDDVCESEVAIAAKVAAIRETLSKGQQCRPDEW
jgi:hypothetical protein